MAARDKLTTGMSSNWDPVGDEQSCAHSASIGEVIERESYRESLSISLRAQPVKIIRRGKKDCHF